MSVAVLYETMAGYTKAGRIGGKDGVVIMLIAMFALLSGCSAVCGVKSEPCNRPYAPGQREMSVVVDGITRNYVLYIPKGYDGKTRLPLVFDFHGSTRTPASEMVVSGLKSIADRDHFVVVFPAGVNGFWNVAMDPDSPDDVKFVSRLIDEISGMASIDKKRIYAAGVSGGGRMASRLGCALSDRIAAVAPVAGVRFLTPCQSRAAPVITFHGTKDTVNPYPPGGGGLNKHWGRDGVEDSLQKWAEHNGCQAPPTVVRKSSEVTKVFYSECADNADVILYRVEGGGHTWPGSRVKIPYGKTTEDIDATELFLNFFAEHPMP